MYGLVDCNSFYASCEKVFRPELANSPVVVLSNNDGCVIARSPEAKALGIVMGTPYFKVKSLCEAKDVSVFSSNYALYGDMSRRVMQALTNWCPSIEVYSIDEAFLDLTGVPKADTFSFGQNLIQTIRQWTGIPVSIGIAPTKTLAKVANRMAKKTGIGVHHLLTQQSQDECLASLSPEDLWGVSGAWGKRLQRLGITTARQLRDADTDLIRKSFSIVLQRLVLELRGEVCLEFDEVPQPKKNITCSRSFGDKVAALSDLEEAVAMFTARAGEKLRRQKNVASGIYIYLRTDKFRASDPQYQNAWAGSFELPTSDSGEMIHLALSGLRKIYRKGYLYKKAGIILLDLKSKTATQNQGNLFELKKGHKKSDALMNVLDHLNRMMGRDTVVFGSQGIEHAWKLRAEFLSPRYTTRWDDLPNVG